MALKDFSDAELKRELERRKEEARPQPKPLAEIDWNKVMDQCKRVVDELAINHFEDEDAKEYIYEEVMKAIYGEKIFEWINENNES